MKAFEEANERAALDQDGRETSEGMAGDLLAAQDYLREAVTVQEHKEDAKALLAKLEVMLLL